MASLSPGARPLPGPRRFRRPPGRDVRAVNDCILYLFFIHKRLSGIPNTHCVVFLRYSYASRWLIALDARTPASVYFYYYYYFLLLLMSSSVFFNPSIIFYDAIILISSPETLTIIIRMRVMRAHRLHYNIISIIICIIMVGRCTSRYV